jgi:hypothetical protein
MLAQKMKIINADPSATGAAAASSGDWVSLENYNHFTAILNIGDHGSTATSVALYRGTSAAGADAALAAGVHYWYNTATATSDTLTDGGETSVAVTVSSGDNQLWVFEVDGSTLKSATADYDFVALRCVAADAITLGVTYILSDARYADAVPPSAIS